MSIADCRLTSPEWRLAIEESESGHAKNVNRQFSIGNRQSKIGN
jgi:hypothetical protein